MEWEKSTYAEILCLSFYLFSEELFIEHILYASKYYSESKLLGSWLIPRKELGANACPKASTEVMNGWCARSSVSVDIKCVCGGGWSRHEEANSFSWEKDGSRGTWMHLARTLVFNNFWLSSPSWTLKVSLTMEWESCGHLGMNLGHLALVLCFLLPQNIIIYKMSQPNTECYK